VARFVAGVVAVLMGVLVLAGCGGGGSHGSATTSSADGKSEPSGPAVSEPNAVVARVGDQVITKAMFAHELAVEARNEGPGIRPPVPPDFVACVARLKAAASGTTVSGPAPGTAALKSDCQELYEVLEGRALDRLIIDDWTAGGAAEFGIAVPEETIQHLIEKYEHERPPGQLVKLLAERDRTLADLATQEKTQLLGEGIRLVLKHKTEHVSQAQVASYYEQHKASFGVPERRVLEIARTATEAAALKVKREIASGKSFASVVKKLPLAQPIFTTDGLVPAYASGMYEEPPLNNAIFAARPGVLSGPVKISIGYYVFEVKGILPASQKTLAQSEAAIRQQLPGELYEQALVAYIKHWRATWRAKTDCLPGYVVPKCREYRLPVGAPPEDPYSFN
jgi:parvulin-like peptidyl-prolyl isomerase